ncbi:type I polyketide synthase [Allosalinactinospora lopnorensis]|uniref:type I polyketide synthase n=1 Tax=Allosalinactinospora lopnorensis TaxID=1352348 RepID=UPI00373FCB8A
MQPVAVEKIGAVRSRARGSLFALDWVPVPRPQSEPARGQWASLGTESAGMGAGDAYPDMAALGKAIDAGAPVPDAVFAPCPVVGAAKDAQAVRSATLQTLNTLQAWLADERFTASRLVLVTRGAVAVRPGDEVHGLAQAPIWGLVRSAQSEEPGRSVLLDLDDVGPEVVSEHDAALLEQALAADEPQLALRDGDIYAPRLSRIGARTAAEPPEGAGAAGTPLDPHGTVLVTGGTGTLGGLVARHLVTAYGVRNLLLISRKGDAAEGVAELRAGLTELGARVSVQACDAADRDALAALLASIPDEHPLTAVVHAAGVLDDTTIASLSADQTDRVLRPKIDAALNLHELTADRPLAAFVLFSSAMGTIGGPGQGNYAAANTFLDALAHHRISRGLPATSLAWGLWEQASGMTGHLGDTGVARMRRSGLVPMSSAHALALFDAAYDLGRPYVVTAHLDTQAPPTQDGPPPSVLRDLVPGPARPVANSAPTEAPDLARQLSGMTGAERDRALLDLIRAHAAQVLGHDTPDAVSPGRPFTELGFDSLTAVEFRNRLGAATGLRLPATLLFDCPTPGEVVRELHGRLAPEPAATAEDGDEKDEAHRAVESIPLSRLRDSGLLDALLDLARGDSGAAGADPGTAADSIDAMKVDDLVGLALGDDAHGEGGEL